jgi:L-seryl-tRNA(Ser) seleniumtransferase
MAGSRRRFLKGAASLPAAAALGGAGPQAASARDVYAELGVRALVNAAGTYTMYSASLMAPEAVRAVEAASRRYVHLGELHEAVGRKISALLGCEDALVTAGAASALTLGTAACIAGKDRAKIARLPDTDGMRNEVILPKGHRNGYDHAVRNAGARLVEAETAEDVERLAGPRTAMLLYFNVHGPDGKIAVDAFAGLSKKLGVPSLIDAAADVPPVEHFTHFLRMGYDLAVFSGGKGIRGPQCSGLLLGRKDLIEAARMNNNPNTDAVGRSNKVGKEEIVGLWAAVEAFVKQDFKALWAEWERRCAVIAGRVAAVPGVRAEVFVPPIANAVPHLRVTWNTGALAPAEVVRRLREGEPRIEVRPVVGENLEVGVWMLEPGEAEIVGTRLAEVLKKG